MAKVRFNPPVHWEAWCSWLLGIWLCISPGLLQFGNEGTATFAAVITGVVLICIEIVTVSTFRWWEEWINVVIGVWLIVAPWILGFDLNRTATANFVVVGSVVVALAFYELRQGEQENFDHGANTPRL
jgi:membrane-bound ClpP family serine protease